MTTTRLGQTDSLACGCDGGGALASIDTALAAGLAIAPAPAAPEMLALAEATGRVLAGPVVAPQPMPPFDNAAMDGYALSAADLAGEGPWLLPLGSGLRAGDAALAHLPGAAHRILTGAPMPEGADTVVPQEAVRLDGGRVVLSRRPQAGAHVRRAGDDLAAGAEILPAGRAIGPREAAALASCGLARVAVHPRPRVAVLATGSELVEPGQPLASGRIWNSNRFQLMAALALPWLASKALPSLGDDPARLVDAFAEAAAGADLLITTGGVSVGDEDHLPRAFRQAGGRIVVRKVAMKPGKPLTIGQLGGMVWLGLPGNPVAAYVGWSLIGLPIVRAMAGLASGDQSLTGSRKIVARLAGGVSHRPERCDIRPARLLGYDATGAQVVECLEGAGSHRVALLAQAEGLVLIPSGTGLLGAGALVEFLPF